MIRYLAIFLILCTASDRPETRLLADGVTIVPADKDYFTKKYRKKYLVAAPEGIEPGAVYIESPYIWSHYRKIDRGGLPPLTHAAYVFYENGCVSRFNHKQGMSFNPEESGYRGVCYVKNGQQLITVMKPSHEPERLVKYQNSYSVSGDTLFLYNNQPGTKYIFLKTKSEPKSDHSANW
ncbi:MAG: hypothetical protein ACO1N9_00435 [Flavobacterium sp.]